MVSKSVEDSVCGDGAWEPVVGKLSAINFVAE